MSRKKFLQYRFTEINKKNTAEENKLSSVASILMEIVEKRRGGGNCPT